MASWTIHDIPDQSGRLAMVTGATGGLGLETALALAGAGAEVILAARNPDKGRAAETLIRQRHPGARVRFEILDLASLASVEAFAGQHVATGRPIDILVNNAGVMAPPRRRVTPDGFELQLGTNYLAHFALTGRLLPLLSAGQARVVQLSSIAHRRAKIRLDDLNAERGYQAFPVYGQSKLAMLMFALELDRRSKAQGWGLTSVAAHPGIASTDLIANGTGEGGRLLTAVSNLAVKLVGHSAAQGALPQLMAATIPGVKGGAYFGPQGWQEFKGLPGRGKIRPQALDTAVAAQLWSASQAMTGVTFG
ncbi:SDR family oxidoreductase [Novosphingobium terrae]|uniref:SDR family oxidoreductase n=1 Tax=Novosphingobium terrae TaxID=2726189 RepID=UPI00197F8913|nr:SDR family oxidoreductase [Novosphingobium terrae]